MIKQAFQQFKYLTYKICLNKSIILHQFRIIFRYAYSGSSEIFPCANVKLAVKAYRFAHEMQITSVIKSLDKKFEQDVTAAEIFIVYNLYKLVDDEAGLAHCRSVN